MQERFCQIWVFWIVLLLCSFLPVPEALSESQKAKVAVVDFKLEGSGHDQPKLGVIIAELLSEELVRKGHVTVVERELIKKILEEKKLGMAGITTEDSASTGALAGVDYILGGSDMRLTDTSELAARLIDAEKGIIVATEDIPYHKEHDLRAVAKNLADMLGRNFGSSGELLPKKRLEGYWEAYASDSSRSRFIENDDGGGTWSYEVKSGEDHYAGLTFDLSDHDIKGKNLLVTCRSTNGYPVYVRFYSFVPGYSAEDNDETFVPVERLVKIGNVAVEIEATHHKMRVPKWWRDEKGAAKVEFNPDDIRHFELEASEDAAEESGADEIEIIRVAIQ